MNRKKILLLSLIAINTLSLSAMDMSFANVKWKNDIGMAGISLYKYDTNKNVSSSYTAAVYGNVGAEYLYKNNIEFNGKISYGKNLDNQLNINKTANAFLSENKTQLEEAYVYISEAYVSYLLNEDTNISLGYQSFSIPFYSKSKDSSIVNNSFESIIAEYIGINDLYVVGGYINRMAGNNNNGMGYNIQSNYKSLYEGDNGATAFLGLEYKYSSSLNANGYYYNINNIADVMYGELIGKYNYSEETLKLGLINNYYLQYSKISRADNYSRYEGSVLGLKTMVGYKNVKINLAYNNAKIGINKINISRGLSPYYTTTENFNIEDYNSDVMAAKINLNLENLNNITYDMSAVYAKSDLKKELVLEGKLLYNYSKSMKLKAIISNKKDLNNTNIDNYMLFGSINYKF